MDYTPYFITGAIYQKRHLLKDSELKKKLLAHIQKSFARYHWELHHWVILNNHYHVLGKSENGRDLPGIIRNIHSHSAKDIFNLSPCEKPVWWNYWDYCPRDEADYLIHLNYLLYNPVKHGYVSDLKNYPFSSFHKIYAEQGRKDLIRQFKGYRNYRTLELGEDDF